MDKKRYTHLMVNGYTKKPPKDESVINPWLYNLIEAINLEIKEIHIKPVMDPIYSYIDKDKTKTFTSTAIIETGYVALSIEIEEEEDDAHINLDMFLSSPLPTSLVLESIENSFGMYDGSYMLLDRANDYKVIDFRSYP